MTTTAERILAHGRTLPEGATLCAHELLHLGTRAAVDQALSRLVKRGLLLRVARGIYVAPVSGRFGDRAPAPEAVTKDLARRTGERITSSGAVAANRLGLTSQNPMRMVYLTSGPTRDLQIGSQSVALRHVPTWQLRAARSKAGDALRALAWFGPGISEVQVRLLAKQLTQGDRAELAALRARAPGWLARKISGLLTDDP